MNFVQQIQTISIPQQLMLETTQKTKNFMRQFLFGGLAAFISKSLSSPIEVVKLRLQLQYALIEKGLIASQYAGILDCSRRLYAENGVYAFFKGNATNALRFFLTLALNFSLKDLFRNIQIENRSNKGNLSFMANILAGGAAGAVTLFLVYPLDYARTRLANQVKLKSNKYSQYNGLKDCLNKTFQSDGVQGLYRGFTVSCMCMVIYRGLYFGIYDSLRPFLPKKYEENMLVTFSLGYFATLVSGVFAYPLDTVRRRIMMTSGQSIKFDGTLGCLNKIYSEGGLRSFFRGGAAFIVSGVTGAAVLSIYDRIKVYYSKKHN